MARLPKLVVEEREAFVKNLYLSNEKLRIEDVQAALKKKDGLVMAPKRISEIRDRVFAAATVEVPATVDVVVVEQPAQVVVKAAAPYETSEQPRVAFLPPRKNELQVKLVDDNGNETDYKE